MIYRYNKPLVFKEKELSFRWINFTIIVAALYKHQGVPIVTSGALL